MTKKKITLLACKDNNFYNFRSELILKLVELGFDVSLVCPKGDKITFFTQRGCRFIELDMDRRGTNPFADLKLIFNYIKILKEEKPDLVLTYTTKSSIYGGIACRWTNTSYIVNNAGIIEANNYSWYVGPVLKMLYKLGFSGSSCMMYQNSRERDYLQSIIGKIHYHDIPGSGVNLMKFKYTDYPKTDDIIRFNYVARIVEFKGINEFLACAMKIKSKFSNTEFVLYGDFDDDAYREKIKDLENKGIIKYGGIQLDMKPYIADAHCVIHPSYYEGVTNVILEHGAMGRPAIASNIPGCREPIDNGISGFTFEVRDVDDLVAKVETFIKLSNEEKAATGKAARNKMEREYDRNIVTDIYLKEINNILSNKE